jgi:tRNA acetyltransferase TAN1
MNLKAIGDEGPKVDRSRIRGLVLGQTTLDPVEAIHKLRQYMGEAPDRFKNIFRVMPILTWVRTEISDMVKEVENQKSKVNEGESFRVTVEKRRTQLRSMEVIKPVADVLENAVDLENPDWVILINILGRKTGVSIIRLVDELNVQKEKYELSMKGH